MTDRISVSVPKGELVGVITRQKKDVVALFGELKKGQPDSGTILSGMTVAKAIQRELTGWENVRLAELIFGVAREKRDALAKQICEFSGLGARLEQKVREYSAQQLFRLQFSVATHLNTPLLWMGGILRGEEKFVGSRLPNLERLLRVNKRTVLLCVDRENGLHAFCRKLVWLEAGVVRMQGESTQVWNAYRKSERREKENKKLPTGIFPSRERNSK